MTFPHGTQPDTSFGFAPKRDTPEEYREDSFAPAPPGWYSAEIVASEVRPTRGGGRGINLQWRINGPSFANKRVFQWINVDNASAAAQGIGRGELYRICHALGLPQGFDSTTQLHMRQCEIRISKEHDSYLGEDVNRIKEVRPIQTAQPHGPPQAPAYQQPPQAPAYQQPPQAPAPGAGRQVASAPTDDDVPFDPRPQAGG